MIYKGIVLGKLKRNEEALNCFSNVCKKYPNNLDAFFQKGVQLAELGQHKKALDVFDEISKKFKDNVNVVYAKSRSMAALERYPESLELLKKAVSASPKVIRAWAKRNQFLQNYTVMISLEK